jgi:hypothetical protein
LAVGLIGLGLFLLRRDDREPRISCGLVAVIRIALLAGFVKLVAAVQHAAR